MRGVFQVTRNLLLRDGATEHPIDLLVRRVAAALARLRGRKGLVGSALRAARRLIGGLRRAVGGIGAALGGSQIRLQPAHLTFEVIDLSLQGLEVRAASQHSYDRCSGHFHNDRALHKQVPFWVVDSDSGVVPENGRKFGKRQTCPPSRGRN